MVGKGMFSRELTLKEYKKIIHCKGCGDKFRVLHGLRMYCEKCKPVNKPRK
jgi:Zn finger protein HypA/HybF involved in hydrogenase expression